MLKLFLSLKQNITNKCKVEGELLKLVLDNGCRSSVASKGSCCCPGGDRQEELDGGMDDYLAQAVKKEKPWLINGESGGKQLSGPVALVRGARNSKETVDPESLTFAGGERR